MPDAPDLPVLLDLLVGGRPVVRLVADRLRTDLQKAGRGTGRHGFVFTGLNAFLESGRELVSVRVAEDGGDLPGSPRWLNAPGPGLDAAMSRSIAHAVASAVDTARDAADLDEAVGLLASLLGRVAEARARLRDRGETTLDQVVALAPAASGLAAMAATLRETFPPIPGLRAPADEPRVSVVIPAHGRFDLTHACIASIAAAGDASPFEVLLVDDGSADETVLADIVFGGAVRVIRNTRNTGFLHTANRGAAAARGEFLLFLNNDTLVQPGWMDGLLQTFEADPGIGIAGAALVFPDGTLQEVGGIVGRYGEATNWGRGGDPDEPRHRCLRDADYVSGAALMIRRTTFQHLGGFDPLFAPGYYEDTDLCFRVREQAGLRVVVQPAARIIHLEGGTAGTDTGSGMKRHQVLNQRQFYRRWQGVLAAHCPAGEEPALEAERRVARRALFIDECTPAPDRDAGSNAALDHMRLLQALGHKVSFVPASDPHRRPGYSDALERLGIECLHAPHVSSVEEALRRLQPTPPDVVYLHRGPVAGRYLALVRHHFPDALIVYSAADLHFLRLEREAALAGDPALREAARRSEATELAAAGAADRVIVHSSAEAALLAGRVDKARVHVLPWRQRIVPVGTPATTRSGVGFIGGYAHRPNVDAAQHLVRDVMPAAWREMPELRCLLVGSDMPREVRSLAGPQVEPVGHVPDLATAMARLRCTVAPLRYGAGIKGKVLASMAHGIPCVMSPIAAEGMDLPASLGWLVAASPADMAQRILALHREPSLAEELGALGVEFVEARCGDAVMLRQMQAVLAPA
jgi:GT2 family glycosyltransferase